MSAKNIQELRRLLTTDKTQMEMALYELYQGQTTEERRTNSTIEKNNRGFNQEDAPVLTPIARRIYFGAELSREDMFCVYALLPKYAAQLWANRQSRSYSQFAEMVG